MFNLLAASSGIGSAAVRGAGNEEAGIGKLRISEMLPPLLAREMWMFRKSFGPMLKRPKLRFWPKGGKSILETSRRGTSQSLAEFTTFARLP